MLDVSGTLHVFLFNDVAFASSHFFFLLSYWIIGIAPASECFLRAVHLTGIHRRCRWLALGSKGEKAQKSKGRPEKSRLGAEQKFTHWNKDGSGFEDELSLRKSFSTSMFLGGRADLWHFQDQIPSGLSRMASTDPRKIAEVLVVLFDCYDGWWYLVALHQNRIGGILHFWLWTCIMMCFLSHHFWGIGNSHFAQVRDVHRLERIGAEAWKVKNDEGQEFPSGLSLKHFW